eukprot:COSAG01_NODE_751_length_13837_cov_78.727981_15_plen_142_part_00
MVGCAHAGSDSESPDDGYSQTACNDDLRRWRGGVLEQLPGAPCVRFVSQAHCALWASGSHEAGVVINIGQAQAIAVAVLGGTLRAAAGGACGGVGWGFRCMHAAAAVLDTKLVIEGRCGRSEICLCHACSYHKIEDGHARG